MYVLNSIGRYKIFLTTTRKEDSMELIASTSLRQELIRAECGKFPTYSPAIQIQSKKCGKQSSMSSPSMIVPIVTFQWETHLDNVKVESTIHQEGLFFEIDYRMKHMVANSMYLTPSLFSQKTNSLLFLDQWNVLPFH